ncbi:hypothetical protein ACPA9J_24560 [Pseudomonas aeruginosa]
MEIGFNVSYLLDVLGHDRYRARSASSALDSTAAP